MAEEEARDPSEELAAWLKDAGRRTWKHQQTDPANENSSPAEPPEMLVEYLERLAGRKFLSKEDVRSYLADVSGANARAREHAGKRQLVRQTLLLLGLLVAYMQYNFIDVSLQIARLPATIVFVPAESGTASNRGSNPVRAGLAERALRKPRPA